MRTKCAFFTMLIIFGLSLKVISQSGFTDTFAGNLSAWTDMYGSDWSIQNNELHGFYSLSNGSIYNPQADLILNDQYQISGDWRASIDFIRVVDDEFPSHYAAEAVFSLWQNSNNKIAIQVGTGGDNWGGCKTQSFLVYKNGMAHGVGVILFL